MDDFYSTVTESGGFVKSCRFVARIKPEGKYLKNLDSYSSVITRDLLYLCESTELPGRGLSSLDVRYYGPKFKIPFQTEYEDVNMSFICRSDSQERRFFDDWMDIINPINSYDFNYKDDYVASVDLFLMDELNEPSYHFTLLKAYPILVNPQPVTWADSEFLRLGITFTYHRWTRPGNWMNTDIQGSDGSKPFRLVNGANNIP
jgi:hypothetical protein